MRYSLLHSYFLIRCLVLIIFAIPIQVNAAVTDPDSGRTVEIQGVDDPDLQFELENRLLQSLKNDDFDGRAELLQAYPMEVDHEQTTDKKIVFRMLASGGSIRSEESPFERALRAIQEDDIDLLMEAVESIPDIGQPSEDNAYKSLITDAVSRNNLTIIKYLHEHCADCELSRSGSSIFNDFDFTTTPYSRMNADVINYRLTAGEMVVFDNRRVLHGREAFEQGVGHRHLHGCYVDRADWDSRLRVLARVS